MKVSPRAIGLGAAIAVVAAAAVAAALVAAFHPWAGAGSHATATATLPAGRSGVRPPLGVGVEGNTLVDSSGSPLALHGVDISGAESVCAQNWTTDPFGGQPEDDPATIAAMSSWHINAVRIPLNEDCWLGINGVEIGGTAYQDAVVHMIRDYEGAGMYVIVDLHWSAPGTQRALAQNPAPDEDHSPAFWRSVATALRDDHRVLFDLYNEPYFDWIAPGGPDAWSCLWQGCELTQYVTGGSPYTVHAKWTSAGFAQLIRVIRGTGATNVIMAAGVNWARDLSGWLAHRSPDPDVIPSWHSYPSANPSLPSECAASWCWNQVIAPIARVVPVVVGETGDSSRGPETFLPAFLSWADAHTVSYLAWTWNAWQNPDDVLVTDMRTGAPTSGEGAYVRRRLLAQHQAAPG